MDKSVPRVPPTTAKSTLSVRSWRRMRARPAPIAVRTAISRWRPSARARSRFAMLAQAMRRTKPATVMRMYMSMVSVGPGKSSRSGMACTP
jgi:hypothetical protein